MIDEVCMPRRRSTALGNVRPELRSRRKSVDLFFFSFHLRGFVKMERKFSTRACVIRNVLRAGNAARSAAWRERCSPRIISAQCVGSPTGLMSIGFSFRAQILTLADAFYTHLTFPPHFVEMGSFKSGTKKSICGDLRREILAVTGALGQVYQSIFLGFQVPSAHFHGSFVCTAVCSRNCRVEEAFDCLL